MSNLRQSCPACNRTLELPGNSVGRMAKCPACETTFRVVAPDVQLGTQPPPHTPPFSATQPPTITTAASPRATESPYSEPPNPFTSNPYQAAPSPVLNPYQPTYAAAPVARVDDLEIIERSIEEIFSPSLSIFGAQWVPLVLSPLIIAVLAIVLMVVPFGIVMAIAQAGNDAVAIVAMLCMMPIAIFLSAYVTVGFSRVALACARNQPSPMSQLIAPMPLVLRMIVVGLVALVVGGGGLMVLGGGLVGIGFALGNEDLAVGLGIMVMFAFILLSFVLQWLLWPLPFIVSDGRSTTLGSFRAAFTIAMHNKLSSFLLILITMVLSFIGSACYIGQLVTFPLTMLFCAVGYLLMTNQPIADPKAGYTVPGNALSGSNPTDYRP